MHGLYSDLFMHGWTCMHAAAENKAFGPGGSVLHHSHHPCMHAEVK